MSENTGWGTRKANPDGTVVSNLAGGTPIKSCGGGCGGCRFEDAPSCPPSDALTVGALLDRLDRDADDLQAIADRFLRGRDRHAIGLAFLGVTLAAIDGKQTVRALRRAVSCPPSDALTVGALLDRLDRDADDLQAIADRLLRGRHGLAFLGATLAAIDIKRSVRALRRAVRS